MDYMTIHFGILGLSITYLVGIAVYEGRQKKRGKKPDIKEIEKAA